MATAYEKDELRRQIDRFFKLSFSSAPTGLIVNDRVADVFMTMLDEAHKCTAASYYIPRPTGGISSLTSLAVGYAKSVYTAIGDDGIRRYCASQTIRNWSQELKMASMGL